MYISYKFLLTELVRTNEYLVEVWWGREAATAFVCTENNFKCTVFQWDFPVME